MHRNHRPDCHKAYMQLSHFKKQQRVGVSRSNRQQTKKRNSKKQRVHSPGKALSTQSTAQQQDFHEENNDTFPNSGMYQTSDNNRNTAFLSPVSHNTTTAPSSSDDPKGDNDSNQNYSFVDLLADDHQDQSSFGNVEDREGADATPSIVIDADTPDTSLLKLYNDINSVLYTDNELPLNKFSIQEKVQVDLLRTLKQLKAPLKTFQEILNWSERAKHAGYRFTEGKPTRKSLLAKLQAMTHLKDLQPQTKKLQLPHSKQTVEIVYFNAKAVMTSLLSCTQLNKDENYLFNGESPLTPPNPRPNYVGDLNTGVNYIQTYSRLIKNPQEEMLLPCILAMDKTHIDIYSRMQMEPLTISYGLMKRNIRSSPIAMRILGYINHQARKENDGNEDTATGLSQGAKNMNDYHAQVYFILKHSGFTELQQRGFKWNIHYQGNVIPVTFRMYVPFIIGDTEGHDQLCGHYKCRTGNVAQLCHAF